MGPTASSNPSQSSLDHYGSHSGSSDMLISDDSSDQTGDSSLLWIIGPAVGGVLLLALVSMGILGFLYIRKQKNQDLSSTESAEVVVVDNESASQLARITLLDAELQGLLVGSHQVSATQFPLAVLPTCSLHI